jgi:hypothetical protein
MFRRQLYLPQRRNAFSAKISVSLKEAGETNFWLKVLFHTIPFSEKEYKSIAHDCTEL